MSFTDSEGITHTAQVAASTLYEAAALAVAEFRKCGLADGMPGTGTRFTIAVHGPSMMHELPMRKLAAWLGSGGKSPHEQALKVRLREMLGEEGTG